MGGANLQSLRPNPAVDSIFSPWCDGAATVCGGDWVIRGSRQGASGYEKAAARKHFVGGDYCRTCNGRGHGVENTLTGGILLRLVGRLHRCQHRQRVDECGPLLSELAHSGTPTDDIYLSQL